MKGRKKKGGWDLVSESMDGRSLDATDEPPFFGASVADWILTQGLSVGKRVSTSAHQTKEGTRDWRACIAHRASWKLDCPYSSVVIRGCARLEAQASAQEGPNDSDSAHCEPNAKVRVLDFASGGLGGSCC